MLSKSRTSCTGRPSTVRTGEQRQAQSGLGEPGNVGTGRPRTLWSLGVSCQVLMLGSLQLLRPDTIGGACAATRWTNLSIRRGDKISRKVAATAVNLGTDEARSKWHRQGSAISLRTARAGVTRVLRQQSRSARPMKTTACPRRELRLARTA